MTTITTRGKEVEIPTCVSELSPEQYEYYCKLAIALEGEMIDYDTFRIRWFSYLLGLRTLRYTILKERYIEELDRQISAIDAFFIVNEEAKTVSLDFDTVVNCLPEYQGYKGPGDMLQGVKFGEFVECYTEAESIDYGSPRDVMRSCEHIARVLYHIPDFTPVPPILAFHAPRLFASVWRAIQTAPIEIYGRKIDFRIIFKSTGESRKDDNTGWAGIAFEIATSGPFGSLRQVEDEDMWTVLIYLYKCKFEYLHDKKQSKKQ